MNEFIERLGWVLVHSLWQFTLVALLAGVIARAMRRNSSAARYGVHVVAMGVMVVVPLVTWLISRDDLASRVASAPGPDAVHVISPGADAARLTSATTLEDPTPDDATRTRRAGGVSPPVTETSLDSETTGGLTPPARQEEVALSLRIKAALHPWLTWIVVVWCIGVAVCSLRPLLGWHTLWRLKRVGVSPASEAIAATLRRVSERLQLRRAVSVLQSTLAQVPVVVGYLRPVVLLPVSLMTSLPAEQLEAILAHELAHVRRHDFVVNLLQTLIETLFFYHPAVWWLSHQIRVEREHCCDDLVVMLLGNRVEYGRALLAIEELRGQNTVFALGATDGSLLARVRRIVGVGSDHSVAPLSDRWLVGLLTIGLVLSIGLGLFVSSQAEVDDERKGGSAWGPESNGLRVRMVAVPVSSDDSLPEMTKSVDQFARGDDVTFAVELQNVSDRPRTLIGVRHDAKGQPRFEGKLAPELFAPYLFEFEFTDANRQPVPRVSRVFLEMSHRLSGALTHSVDPGKSLVVVLRPSRFYSPMDHRLPPGKYQARVRYHGPSDQDLTFFRSHRSNEQRAKAWYGEVTSNPVTFTVANEAIEARRSKLVWGPAKDGLQAAVEFRPLPGAATTNDPPGTFLTKPEVSTIFHVKNVSDHAIKFVSETGRQGDDGTATDEAGKTIRLEIGWASGWPTLVRWTLKPGEVAELRASSGVSLLKKPGKYTVRYDINFGSLRVNNGVDKFPKDDDWQQVLPTGDTPITIRARPAVVIPVNANGEIRGVLLDAETGEPVERAKVACGALINPSGQRLGSSAVTDDEGRYRLHVPKPGFYNVWLHEYPGGQWMTAVADDGLLVEAGQATASQMFLVNARKIVGTLVWNGKPVASPVVKCNSAARPESLVVEYHHKMRTEADGSFWFAVPPGRVYLYVDEESQKTKDSETGGFRSAHAHVDVPANGDVAPIMLALQDSAKKLGESEWLKRSTPGTQIVRRAGTQNVTGTVVDESGKPIAGAKLLRDDGSIISSNDKGEFRIETPKAIQLTLHAVAPGYHVWFGMPTSGDELKIVMEKKVSATSPKDGLDFLKPYPKLHGLSLDMTEPQFLEIVKQQELKTRKTVEGEKVTHHIALGDGHTLIVMFDKDGKCSGIQRVRGEDDVPARPKAVLGRESFKGRVMIDGPRPKLPLLTIRDPSSSDQPREGNKVPDDLRSNPAEGSGDPRRVL